VNETASTGDLKALRRSTTEILNNQQNKAAFGKRAPKESRQQMPSATKILDLPMTGNL